MYLCARTRTKMRCVLTQIRINKVHEVLAQITRKGACGQFEWPINLCNLCNEHDVTNLN